VFDPSRIEIKYKVQKGVALPDEEIQLLKSIFTEVWQRFNDLEAETKEQNEKAIQT